MQGGFGFLRLILGGDIAFHRKLVSPISVASLHLLLLAELLHYCANSLIIMKKKFLVAKNIINFCLLLLLSQCSKIWGKKCNLGKLYFFSFVF